MLKPLLALASLGMAATALTAGAATAAGLFTPGTRQPGTDYNDYCSGDLLQPGVHDTFEAVTEGGGTYWKSVGPITQWTFDQGTTWPTTSTRDDTFCHNGDLT
ncbi:hypothetical protein [Nocardia sp. NPDC020380]|uniref:hypothetical protein n=1 Tax=Nocardia sp. NPDC020380 TaxID=3364309 RepID=UPI0037B3E24B